LRLTILRHGHATETAPGGGRDFDRPLSPRGHDEALRAGRQIAAEVGPPDLALVSPALRTRQTAEALDGVGLAPRAREYPDELYLATLPTLLERLRAARGTVAHLLLVGHNPGLSELVAALRGDETHAGLGTAEWVSFELRTLD
jgi:phosphohistidine phosphatase